MYRVYYSYTVKNRNGLVKTQGSAHVDVNACSEGDARLMAEGAAARIHLYEQGSYFSTFRVESVSKR